MHPEHDKPKDRSFWSRLFDHFASQAAQYAGRPAAFIAAVALIVGWAATGPLFGFSETWQLIVNTATTIITFLMVFLIQHAQNKDSSAVQLKLSELIVAVRRADNKIADADEMTEDELRVAREILVQKSHAEKSQV